MTTGGESRIGRFRILETLGVGGFAAVYRAHDPELASEVAIKVLHEQWCTDPEIRSRFISEARIMRNRQGDHMIAVHDIVEVDGRPAIVMEYCQRGALDRRLIGLGRCLTLTEALGLIDGLADATSGLHRAAIVHRDIKPSNLLLRQRSSPSPDAEVGQLFGPDEELVLGDFGLAKVIHPDQTKLTIAGGTPGYGAPEQFRGTSVGPAADVYAASAVVVTAMARVVPAAGAGPPFDHGALAATGPLQQELVRGLALDPADRHRDIETWRHDLRAAATTATTVRAAPAPTGVSPPRSDPPVAGRRRLLVTGAVVAALAVAALVAVALLTAGDPADDGGDQATSADDDTSVDDRSDGDAATPTGEAVALELDEVVGGSVASGELVQYDLAAADGGDVFFDAWVEDGSCADRGDPQMSWRLIDAETDDVVFNDYTSSPDGCFDADKGPITLDPGRRYRLLIFYLEECGGCAGRYSLAVRSVAPPDTFTIELDQVISPGRPGPGAGVVETPGASDVYRLDVAAGDRLEIDNFVDVETGSDCGEGDRGLVVVVPNVVDGEEPYWDAVVSQANDCAHNDIGPFLIDQGGTLEIRYSYERDSDSTGSYSFTVRRAQES